MYRDLFYLVLQLMESCNLSFEALCFDVVAAVVVVVHIGG